MALGKLGSGSKSKYPSVKAKTTTTSMTQKTKPNKAKFTR